MAKFLPVVFIVGSLFVTLTLAADADPISDFCVADLNSTLFFNALVCKSPEMTTSTDFLFTGFEVDADTSTALGVGISVALAGLNYAGLNTQGLSLVRFDYRKGGHVPPHTHPRASEVIICLKGRIYVGFVDTSGKLWDATLKKGDMWVFPRGLLHFQHAVTSAISISALNSQNPGVQFIPSALFGSNPSIESQVLFLAFGIPISEIEVIKKNFNAQ